ncbi:hypothetical protein [Flaviaesturariibacter terrae]
MKQLLFSLLLLLSVAALAAPTDYRVYYVKGAVKKGATLLRRGDSLYAQDAVQLPPGAELYLVCRDYSLLQLKKPGTFALRSAAACPGKASSLTASYFKYVWDELRSHHGSPEQNPRHYMRNKGAVSRGDCPLVQTALYTDTIYAVKGASLPIYWKGAIHEPFVSIFPDEHDRIPTQQVAIRADRPMNLSLLLGLAGKEDALYWSIGGRNNEGCNRKYLQVLPAAEYRSRVAALLQSVPVTSAPETALLKAFVLEENHFPVEALRYYALAFQLDPKNPRTGAALNHYHEIE